MQYSEQSSSIQPTNLHQILQLTKQADEALQSIKTEVVLLGRNVEAITEKTELIQKTIQEAQRHLSENPNESLRLALKHYHFKLIKILTHLDKGVQSEASIQLQTQVQMITKVFEKTLFTSTSKHIQHLSSTLTEEPITQSSDQILEYQTLERANRLLESTDSQSLKTKDYLEAARGVANLELFKTDSEVVTTCQLLYYQAALKAFQEDNIQGGLEILKEATEKVLFLPSHPLMTIGSTINERCGSDLEKQAVGIACSGLGTAAVKDLAIRIGLKTLTDKTQLMLEIKLNSQAIKELNLCLNSLSSLSWQGILESHFSGIHDIEFSLFNYYVYFKSEKGIFQHSMENLTSSELNDEVIEMPNIVLIVNCERYRLKLPGLGYIIFPSSSKQKSLSDQLEIYIDHPDRYGPKELLHKIQNLLTLVGCPPVLVESRHQDQAKRDLFQLYKTFYPQFAYALSHEEGIFNLSIENIKEKFKEIFIANAREKVKFFPHQFETATKEAMKQIEEVEQALEEIEMIETFPGKLVPSFGISNAMRLHDAYGMVTTVTGGGKSNEIQDLIFNTVIMIKEGIFSSTIRFSAGKIDAVGSSSKLDIASGGGESVFCRLVTKNLAEHTEIREYQLRGRPLVLILVDLEACNPANTYCASHDTYGSRQEQDVSKRLSLIELAENFKTNKNFKNEIMIRDHLPNLFIRRIVVMNPDLKNEIIEALKQQGMLDEKDETIYIKIGLDKEINIEDFIIVGTGKLTEEMWS